MLDSLLPMEPSNKDITCCRRFLFRQWRRLNKMILNLGETPEDLRELSYGVLYINDDEPKLFSPDENGMYVSRAITEFGYPISSNTDTKIIVERIDKVTTNFETIENLEELEQFGSDYINSINKHILNLLPNTNCDDHVVQKIITFAATVSDVIDATTDQRNTCTEPLQFLKNWIDTHRKEKRAIPQTPPGHFNKAVTTAASATLSNVAENEKDSSTTSGTETGVHQNAKNDKPSTKRKRGGR